MAKLNSFKEVQSLLLDTDVIVNWLTKEVETQTAKDLWTAPYRIISLIENKKLKGFTNLTTLLEIRFLLRRKREFTEQQIEKFINEMAEVLEVVIPDEISLLESNRLQSENLLDPFDAILLGVSITLKPIIFVSRDKEFLKIASSFIPAFTPENFLQQYNK